MRDPLDNEILATAAALACQQSSAASTERALAKAESAIRATGEKAAPTRPHGGAALVGWIRPRRAWAVAAAIACAAAGVAIVAFKNQPPDPPVARHPVLPPAPQARVETLIQEDLPRVLEREQQQVLVSGGAPVHVLRYHAAQRLAVIDEQQRLRAEWFVPREEIVLIHAVVD